MVLNAANGFHHPAQAKPKAMVFQSVIAIAVIGFAVAAFARVLPISPFAEADVFTAAAGPTSLDLDSAARPHRLILEKCAKEDCSDTPQ